MVIKTFSNGFLENRKVNYEKEFKQFFKNLMKQKTTKLVIDLRNSQGGFSPQAELLKYLIKEPFIVTKKAFTIVDALPDKEYFTKDKYYNSVGQLQLTPTTDDTF